MKADTPKHAQHIRNQEIVNLSPYLSGPELGKKYGISSSRVNRIIKDYTARLQKRPRYIYLEDYDKPPTPENLLPR